MKRGALVLGGLLGAALLAVGYTQRPIEPLTPPPAPTEQVQAQPAQPAAGGSGAPRLVGAAEPAKPQPFRFRGLDIDTAGEVARLCFSFTRDLVADGFVRYEDYVTLEPTVKTAWSVEGSRLCATGLDFAREYSAQLKPGLPAADGSRIETGQRLDASLRNRPPMVGFGPGVILPRHGTSGVPVTPVNVDRLNVRVIRVGERMLARLAETLLDERQVGGYQADEWADEDGQLLWHGTMDVRPQPNQAVTTVIPVREAIGERKPGAYVVMARDAADEVRRSWADHAVQWLLDTDMGLTTFQGEDGLRVFARSLDAGRPLAGVRLSLIARNNEELGKAVTEADGGARFAPGLLRGAGGMVPVAVMAHGPDGDFTFLDLRRPAFDLTDRGVEGRPSPGPVDAFLYSERGIYRPGETVHLGLLLRDAKSDALRDLPITVVLNKPNGREFQRLVLDPRQDGGAAGQFALSETAPHGRWEAVASIGAGKPVGRASFLVQDFVPQKLKVVLTAPEGPLDPAQPLAIGVEARFLYGAPAAGLSAEAEVDVERDPNPFPALAGFRFGVEDERFETQTATLEIDETDEEGRTVTAGTLPAPPATSHPL
ncbi:MAG: alpha-2-macroglobulin family protein, partial [Alphaproteobacteria bacterium]|nr:alpha-2-macroglobulin family protein [Alphaproteobacteria bacterium]